jgi:hypothetical protein
MIKCMAEKNTIGPVINLTGHVKERLNELYSNYRENIKCIKLFVQSAASCTIFTNYSSVKAAELMQTIYIFT